MRRRFRTLTGPSRAGFTRETKGLVRCPTRGTIPVRGRDKSVRGLRDILSTFIGNIGFDIHFRLEKV